MFPEEHRSLCPLMRLHQCRTCSRWTILPCIPAPSVAHANGSKVSPTINAHPVRIGMARHPRRAWSSRRTQDDQRPTPTSGAAVVAQHRVLLPMPTPLTACTQGPRQRHVPAALGRNMSRGARQKAPGQIANEKCLTARQSATTRERQRLYLQDMPHCSRRRTTTVSSNGLRHCVSRVLDPVSYWKQIDYDYSTATPCLSERAMV